MDGQEPSGFLNTPTSSTSPLPSGYFATGTKYTGMVEAPAPVAPVVTPTATETAKKSKHCSKLEGCVCGTLLGCMIAADGDVTLFFDLLGKFPVAIFLWFDFSEFS